jgi:ADP-ribose pyrophosphatase
MTPLKKYLNLMKKHPDLFENTGVKGEIKIIHDLERIRKEQARLQAKLIEEGKPIDWIEIGVLSEDQWFWVVRDLVEFPNGKVGGYLRWINRKSQEGGFNVILVCIQEKSYLLIKKYQHGQRGYSWEFPRGFGEPGLTAKQNARKELIEEIGVKPSQLNVLAEAKEGEGGTTAFLANIPPQQNLTLDIGEGIVDYRWVTFKELEQYIVQNKVNDRFSLWAFALVEIKKFSL